MLQKVEKGSKVGISASIQIVSGWLHLVKLRITKPASRAGALVWLSLAIKRSIKHYKSILNIWIFFNSFQNWSTDATIYKCWSCSMTYLVNECPWHLYSDITHWQLLGWCYLLVDISDSTSYWITMSGSGNMSWSSSVIIIMSSSSSVILWLLITSNIKLWRKEYYYSKFWVPPMRTFVPSLANIFLRALCVIPLYYL